MGTKAPCVIMLMQLLGKDYLQNQEDDSASLCVFVLSFFCN